MIVRVKFSSSWFVLRTDCVQIVIVENQKGIAKLSCRVDILYPFGDEHSLMIYFVQVETFQKARIVFCIVERIDFFGSYIFLNTLRIDLSFDCDIRNSEGIGRCDPICR